MTELSLTIGVFVLEIECFGPLIPVVMIGCYLQGPTIWHHDISRHGIPCPWKCVPYRPLRHEARQAEIVKDILNHRCIFRNLIRCPSLICVYGVCFEEVYLPYSDE